MTVEWSRLKPVMPAALVGAYAAAVSLAPRPGVALALASAPLAAALFWWTLLEPARWLYVFFAAALLLPPLPIALGDSGPHPALAVAALGVLTGLLHAPGWQVRIGSLGRSLLLYSVVLLGSAAPAALYSGPVIASQTLARVLLFAISVYVFFYARSAPGDSFRLVRFLFGASAAAALFACLDFYFQFPAPAGYGPQFVWLASGVYRRAQGLFYDASALGNFCAFFLAMTAAGLIRPRREAPVSRPALLAGGAVLSAALIFSYSRASLLNLTASVLALLILSRRRLRFRRLIAVAAACIAAGTLAAWVFLPSFVSLYWLRLRLSFEYFSSATGAVLSGRLASWHAVGAFLLENPWHALIGVGYKTLPYSNFIGERVIADNMYLSMLAETGLVGLAALVLMSGSILSSSWRAARSGSARASFLGTWIFCFWTGQLVQMMSQDVLTYWRALPVYFCVLGLAMRELDADSVC